MFQPSPDSRSRSFTLLTHAARRLAAVLSLACLASCSDPEVSPNQRAPSPEATNTADVELGSEAWHALPAGERARRIQQLQAGSDYTLQEEQPGVLSAWHRTMALHTTFARGRVSVVAATGAEEPQAMELAATAWGCAGAMVELGASEPVSEGNHAGVSYPHDGISEWYTLGPAGLEQGFTIRALPECAQRGAPLRIRLRFLDAEGAIADVEKDGSEAVLTTAGGRAVHYSDPYGVDAAGSEHRVRITGEESLSLEIDASSVTLPLTVDPLIWEIQQNILASDFKPPSYWPNDFFGHAVAVSGDTAAIGAYSDDDKGEDAGAVYVFTRVPPPKPGLRARWTPQQKLTALDAARGDLFGGALAIDGDTILVGAASKSNQGTNAGAAYVFVRHGTQWTQQQRLVPADGAAGAQFGAAVTLSGDNALIGAPFQAAGALAEVGAAYAFGRTGVSWVQQRKFAPAAAAAGLHFGAALAVSGATAAVGRDSASGGGVDWFVQAGSTWNSTGSGLTSSAPHFGSALSMSDTTTAIGAPGDLIKGAAVGSVSVTSNSAPHALTTLTANDGLAGDKFGYALALSNNTLLVGAPGIDTAPGNGVCSNVPDSGGAYVFTQSGGAWSLQKKLTALNLIIEQFPLPPCFDPGIALGTSVATAGPLVLLGAPFRADWGAEAMPNTGAVFEHEYAATNASLCTQNSDCLSNYCVEGVCCKSGCDGVCSSCLADLKDPAHSYGGDWVTGVCGEITVDTDPKNGCDDMGTFCGTTGVCSGNGSCQAAHPFGTQCGAGASSSCASATSTAANALCINYTCASYFTFDCQPGYLCKGGFCKTNCQSNADCDDSQGYLCLSGLCKLGGALGEACDKDKECLSQHCADGVCCDAACDGACVACVTSRGAGTCSAVVDDPGDPPGSCSAEAGSGGEGGAPEAHEAGSGGEAEAGAAGQPEAGQGGEGGVLAEGGAAGAQPNPDDGYVECVPACARGLHCDHTSGHCQEILITACDCRIAGSRGASGGPLALLAIVVLGFRRRRRAA